LIRFVFSRVLPVAGGVAILSVSSSSWPGPPGIAPAHPPHVATPEDYADARRYLGLDRPYVEQYLSFVGRPSPATLAIPSALRRR